MLKGDGITLTYIGKSAFRFREDAPAPAAINASVIELLSASRLVHIGSDAFRSFRGKIRLSGGDSLVSVGASAFREAGDIVYIAESEIVLKNLSRLEQLAQSAFYKFGGSLQLAGTGELLALLRQRTTWLLAERCIQMNGAAGGASRSLVVLLGVP